MSSSDKVTDSSSDVNSHQQSPKSKGYQLLLQRLVHLHYTPQPIVVIETFGSKMGIHLPHPWMMQRAFVLANQLREKELPKHVQDAYYTGVDLNHIPSSTQLTEASTKGLVALENCFFQDFLTAEYYRGALRPDKSETTRDMTVPLTTSAQKGHVQLLVRAFNSTNNCDDNPQMVRPFVEKRHDPKLVEVLCWGILKSCIMWSNSDEPLLTAYEPSKSKNSPSVSTFAERFDEIVKSMTRSKTICKHLYDPPYVNVFVDDPVRAVRRVDANRDLNRQKGQIMGKGKQLLDEEVKAKGGTPEPRSRKRRAVAIEGRDSSADDKTPTRRSLVVTMPVRPTPAPGSSTRRSLRGLDTGPTSPNITPLSTAFEVPMSPMPAVKEEDNSPRRIPSTYALPSPSPSFPPPGMVSQPTTFGGFHPYQRYGYGGGATSFGYGSGGATSLGYGSNPFSTGYNGMRDLFGLDQPRQRQSQFASYQPGYAYTPINLTTASAPTTPDVPGFVSGEASSNTDTSPTTPSTRGFAIPEEVTPVGEDEDMTVEAEHPDAEGEEASDGF